MQNNGVWRGFVMFVEESSAAMDGNQIQSLLLKHGITPTTVVHRGEQRIKLVFKMDARLTDAVKKLRGRKWSATMRCWHIPKDKKLLEELLERIHPGYFITADGKLKPPAEVTGEEIQEVISEVLEPVGMSESHDAAVAAYVAMLCLKNYSANTLKNYRNWFILFLKYFPGRKPSTITKNEIMDFLVAFKNSPKWSATSQNQLINSIKFFYEKLLNRPRDVYELPRAKKPYLLPTVFSAEEVKKIILAPDNIKHRTILCLAYAGGLRVSEIVNLKIEDIDTSRMVMTLRGAKGKKDRQVMLSEKLLDLFRTYYREQEVKPKKWLFEGYGNTQYSIASAEKIIKAAKKKVGIKKKGSIQGKHTCNASQFCHSPVGKRNRYTYYKGAIRT
jgi:integrase/recombinase XerD